MDSHFEGCLLQQLLREAFGPGSSSPTRQWPPYIPFERSRAPGFTRGMAGDAHHAIGGLWERKLLFQESQQ
jgi:hypothetical protein